MYFEFIHFERRHRNSIKSTDNYKIYKDKLIDLNIVFEHILIPYNNK